MSLRHPTRRSLVGVFSLLISALTAPRLAAQVPPPLSDRGIGGTGVAPPQDLEDRGIGGTGVVGTIRRFGSIVVNGLRIGYAPDVRVTIDGRRATPADLRLGHVVRAIALADDDRLSTRAIAVMSEVIGKVEGDGADGLTVLGQSVDTRALAPGGRWRIGRRVAVSGLRRPDGVIVASLIEPARGRLDRVAGPLQPGSNGTVAIGRLTLRGVDPALVGERILVAGRRRGRTFLASQAEREIEALQRLGSQRLSLDVFLERQGDDLRLGSGLAVENAVALAALPENGVVRAVLSASVGPGGSVVIDRIDVVDRLGHATSSIGAHADRPASMPGQPAGFGRDQPGPGGFGSPHGAGPGSNGPGGNGQVPGGGPGGPPSPGNR